MLLLLIGNTVLSLIAIVLIFFLVKGGIRLMTVNAKFRLDSEIAFLQNIIAKQEKIIKMLSKGENHDK